MCFGYLYMYLLLEICSTLYLYCFNNKPEGEGGGPREVGGGIQVLELVNVYGV